MLFYNEVSMNKTRGLLSLVALLTIIGQVFVFNSHLANGWKFLLHVSDGILLLSALTMLLFSFFRVGITASGEICYNPDNWYWKTMKGFSDFLYSPYSSPFYQGKVSLCKAFWLTVIAGFMVTIFLMFAVGFIVLLWHIYWKFGLLKIIFTGLGIVAFTGVIIGTIVGTVFISKKIEVQYCQIVDDKPRLRNAMEIIRSILLNFVLFGLIFFMIVVMPIIVIMEEAKVSLYIAIIYYAVGIVGLALTIGGACLLIWSIFSYLPKVMRGSMLGQFLSAKKKQFCPTLVACSVKKNESSFS